MRMELITSPDGAGAKVLSEGIRTFNHVPTSDLAEECQGSGIGQQIIIAAEERAIELSCLNAFVEMTSW